MIQKIRALAVRYWDILSYLFFGVCTTGVNYLIYIPCYNLWGLSASVSNVVAWAAAVAFAYLTNKPFVFRSMDWSLKTVVPELTAFVGCRIGSGVMETVILLMSVDLLGWNGNRWKLLTQIMVVIANYAASKLLVFRKK